MINLSRRGWNNVLIFASLFMILIFNGVHQKLLNNTESAALTSVKVLPIDYLLLTLDLPNISIERMGKTWRQRPDHEIEQQRINLLMRDWHQAKAEVMNAQEASAFQNNFKPDWVVIAWFAGEAKGYVLQGYTSKQQLVLFDQQRALWLKMPALWQDKLILSSSSFLKSNKAE